jgi:hypothetical protein
MLRKKRNMVCSHVLTHNMHTYTRQARPKHADSPPQEGCYASEKAKHGPLPPISTSSHADFQRAGTDS